MKRAGALLPTLGLLLLGLLLGLLPFGAARAAITLDPGFWDSYQPFGQYSRETIRDLTKLNEGDLLETARDIDGLELRLVGRMSAVDPLVSARLVIDSSAKMRLQIKLIPFELPPTGRPRPESLRRPLTAGQAAALEMLLDKWDFWDAPYSLDGRPAPGSAEVGCENAGYWIIEAVRPGAYEIVARSTCGGLDPAVAEIRDFLLGLARVPTATESTGAD